MEGDYLELSWDVVQNLVLLENKQLVQLNKEQCGLLTEKLVEIVPSLRDAVNSVPLQKRALLLFVLQELYHLVKEAEVIIRACCSEDPLKAAVKLQDSIEAFGECFFNTAWLAGVIRIVISGTKDFSVASFHQRLVEEIASFGAVCQSKEGIRRVFEAKALKDRRSLTEMLELRKSAKGVVDEQESQIVAYLMELMPSSFGGTFTLPTIEPRQLQFVKKLGSGCFGTVFEARWLGQSFAQKVFQGIEKESFEKDVAALAGLHHPHVVRLFGTSLDTYRPRCSLVMELMSEDLGAYIVKRTISHSDQPPFNLHVAIDIMLQIADGMKYLHQRRITHGNLKSSNILIHRVESSEMAEAGYLRVKLADFGLAKTMATSANFSSPLSAGTGFWRAPELFPDMLKQKTQKRSNLSLAADVWSFGSVCYELLTGDNPFKEEKLWDHPLKEEKKIKRRIKYARTIPQVDSPSYLSSLITMCWDADHDRRPTFSEICATLLHIKGCLLIVLDLSLEAMDINNGWMHPSVPLCIHTSKGIGDSEQLGQIKTFLAERNSLCTSSSWFATWQEELKTGGNMSWKSFEDLNDARVHVVWILYSLSERRHFGQLLHLKDALEPYGVPVQILIVKDTDDVDCHGQQLGKNLLYKRGFLFPDVLTLQEYLITGLDWSSGEVGKAEDSQVALFDKALWAPQGALRDNTMELKQLDNKALWASAEVIKTIANIQKTAQVINDVASILDKRGVNIWIKALMRLQGHHTSAWCGTFTVKCLCKIWEVPKTMETTIWQKLASWELDETGESRLDGTMSKCQLQEGPTSLTLNDGKYLQFSTRVAGVILYCKAFHLTGWSKIDYSQEFDSFYAAYRHWFEEFLKRFNFGISSKILRTLFPSSDTAAGTLKQQVQTSLEKFFVEILNH
ncbi:unnamed protein product [Sphagnum troendelagicum]